MIQISVSNKTNVIHQANLTRTIFSDNGLDVRKTFIVEMRDVLLCLNETDPIALNG